MIILDGFLTTYLVVDKDFYQTKQGIDLKETTRPNAVILSKKVRMKRHETRQEDNERDHIKFVGKKRTVVLFEFSRS